MPKKYQYPEGSKWESWNDPLKNPYSKLRRSGKVGRLKKATKKLETMNKDSTGKSTIITLNPKPKVTKVVTPKSKPKKRILKK